MIKPSKVDLIKWNQNEVTQYIFSQLKDVSESAQLESTLHETVDKTALATARREGFLEGLFAFFEEFLIAKEEAEKYDEN